jgi:hypothetical protein
MGFATLVNMFVAVCVPSWGGKTVHVAWAMSWVDFGVSVVCCLGLPFQMYVSILALFLFPHLILF